MTLRLQATDDGVRIAVKAVPGSSRDRIAGILGDALKVCVAAPPEDGKANQRICEMLAVAFGVTRRDVAVVSGQAARHKSVDVRGLDVETARARLDAALRS